jgi:hypothetical protein
MRATALSLLLIPLAVCVAADPAQEVLDLFTGLAASLSAGNVQQFMSAFDPAMPGYAKLRENITAMIGAGAIESFVDVTSEGDAQSRKVEVTWRLRLKRAADATASAPREAQLRARVEKQNKKWKIVALDPVAFFSL